MKFCAKTFVIKVKVLNLLPLKLVSEVLNNAKIAQLVERHLAKVEVAGSNPVFRSTLMSI